MSQNGKVPGYARALFEVARSEGALARVGDELFRLARALESNHDLRQALTDIAVAAEGKDRLISELLEGKASPHTINFVKFLVTQGLGRDLVEISDEVARLAAAEARREVAEVRTAVPLDDKQTARLAEALGKATGRDVELKVIVDPGVIGGVYARVGDTIIDGSVRHKLESLRELLK